MTEVNYEEVRQVWLKNVPTEAKLWLNHINEKEQTILGLQNQKMIPVFEIAELLFNIFTYLNWLAHIDLRNDKYVGEKEMVDWLMKVTLWPQEIVEAFWYCLRNPTMHLGRTFIFSDYDRKSVTKLKLYADFNLNMEFDPKQFQPQKFKPSEKEDGWLAVYDPFDNSKLNVTYYFAGLERKLNFILKGVLERIETADKIALTRLFKINSKILPFRFYRDY